MYISGVGRSPHISEQLESTRRQLGWSVEKLKRRSGLRLHYTSLARKLRRADGQELGESEIEAIVEAFIDVGAMEHIQYPRRRAA